MARYPNGRIPKSALVHLGGKHWLTPGTKARWDALVADVLKNEGVRLRITSGPNAYRDYAAQVEAKKKHGSNAAWPGTSSHGGVFKGRDSMAIDVGNWGVIGKTKFYAYARKHGFEPNYFDWEPWHIIDWSPWTVPSGGGSTPAPEEDETPIPEVPEEEDDMPKNTGLLYRAPIDEPKERQREYLLILNTGSGYQGEISSGLGGEIAPDRRREFANAFDTTSIIRVNEEEATAFKSGLPAVRG